MIVSRTPLRISFFGGATDYPAWFRTHGGIVLSATIDKFCYLTVRHLPPFFEHKNRIVYRMIETTQTIGEIQHPTVRAVLGRHELEAMEIHHDADLPARSGMGTSSAFTVGLLNAVYALKGERRSAKELATEAIDIEVNAVKDTVGCQDQIAAAFGGLNLIRFPKEGDFDVERLPEGRLRLLERHLLLFYTGVSRTASDVAKSYVPELATAPLSRGMAQVSAALEILFGRRGILEFGELLDEAWAMKKKLSPAVSTPELDALYHASRVAGAIGGKILGAGGGGFLLLFAHPDDHEAIKRALAGKLHVPFRFGSEGSKIIVYDP